MSFSLRTQLIAVAVIAVLLACLAFPSPVIGDLFFTGAFLVFVFGVLGAVYGHGQRRTFLIGFLIVFGLYCWMTMWGNDMRTMMTMNYALSGARTRGLSQGLITTRLLSSAFELIHGAMGAALTIQPGRSRPSSSPENFFGQYMSFLNIGHVTIALVLGWIGGSVALRMATPPAATAAAGAKKPIDQILEEMDLK